jgi:hypothetical protein
MPEAINANITDSVSASNLKMLGDTPALQSQISTQDLLGHRNRMNILAETSLASSVTLQQAAVGNVVRRLTELDISESTAQNKVATGNDLAAQLGAMLTALNSGQQGVKSAITTPPTSMAG